MNYTELQAAICEDTHRTDYAGAVVQRCILLGEAYIFSRLEAYGLEITLTDADRVAVGSPIYYLPDGLTRVRVIFASDGTPLEQVDESSIAFTENSGLVTQFAVRPTTVIFGDTPGTGATFTLAYFGFPAALSAVPTNTLLDEWPQLYMDAAMLYVFRRAQDYESAQIAVQSVNGHIDEINRKMKKHLGGARAVPMYNVFFRSSY